jgi:multiple sugar transport system substrate-binding protein
MREKLKTDAAGGTQVDVTETHHSQVRDLGPGGIVQDLTRLLRRDALPKEVVGWEPNQWPVPGGKQYGVPWSLAASCLYYNKALFDQAGVAPPPDTWTWEQFVDAATRLTKPGADDSQTIWGAADYGGGNYQYMNAFITAYGGSVLNPAYSESTLTAAPALAAIDARASWFARLRIQPVEAALSSSPLFSMGRLAMLIGGSFSVGGIKAGQLGNTGTWDVAPLPKGPKRRAGLGHELGIGIPTGAKHPEESWALVKHLSSPDGLVPFGRAGRIIPSNRTVWDAAIPSDGRPTRFKKSTLDLWEETAVAPPFTPRADEHTVMWREELDAVWKGERAPQDGARAFKQRIDTLLKELKGQGLL